METLKNRIVKLLDTLNERVYGKEEVMAWRCFRLWQERASSC